MIVKMKKITIMVMNKYSNESLQALRNLGILHIRHVHEPAAEGITALEHRTAELDKAIAAFGEMEDKQREPAKRLSMEEVSARVKETLLMEKVRQNLFRRRQELRKEMLWFEEWGDISLSSLAELRQAGVFIKLYSCGKELIKTIPNDKMVQILKYKGNIAYAALISTYSEDTLDFPEVKIPDINRHSLHRKIDTVNRQFQYVNNKVKNTSAHINCFIKYRQDLQKRLEFLKVKFGMAYHTDFSYLQGFCPQCSVKSISDLAEKEGWAYLFEEPDNPEEVPTLLKNPSWINTIAPVLKFMGILPGYGEFDVSICFLLFFSLFCSILVGDAGYGILFVLLAFLLQKKAKAVPKDMVFLIYTLGIGMVIWGAITGTWFGWEGAVKLPLFKSLVVNNLNTWVETNQPVLMRLCFLIGAVHLTVAHVMSAFTKIKSPAVIGEFGWIGVVWGMFFYAGYFVLNIPLPVFANPLILGGAALVLLFANFQNNFLKSLFAALSALPLTLLAFISTFADVVSYIRLFAVGFASSTISSTFNTMLLGNISGFMKAVIAIVFLIAVHAFNIVLGLVAIFVHGIRLNLLEFSSHSGLQWLGKEYKPFRE